VRSAGEWLTVAERVRELREGLRDSRLWFWADSLEFLAKDCEREAGATAVHELRGDAA
jgi:hypothetical protein